MKFTITIDDSEDDYQDKLFALVNAIQMRASIQEFHEDLRRKYKHRDLNEKGIPLEEIRILASDHFEAFIG